MSGIPLYAYEREVLLHRSDENDDNKMSENDEKRTRRKVIIRDAQFLLPFSVDPEVKVKSMSVNRT